MSTIWYDIAETKSYSTLYNTFTQHKSASYPFLGARMADFFLSCCFAFLGKVKDVLNSERIVLMDRCLKGICSLGMAALEFGIVAMTKN